MKSKDDWINLYAVFRHHRVMFFAEEGASEYRTYLPLCEMVAVEANDAEEKNLLNIDKNIKCLNCGFSIRIKRRKEEEKVYNFFARSSAARDLWVSTLESWKGFFSHDGGKPSIHQSEAIQDIPFTNFEEFFSNNTTAQQEIEGQHQQQTGT